MNARYANKLKSSRAKILHGRRGAAAIGMAALVGVAALGTAATMGRVMQMRTKQMKMQAGKTVAVDLVKRALMDASALVAGAKWVKDPIVHPQWGWIETFTTPPSHMLAVNIGGLKGLKVSYCNPVQFTDAENATLMAGGTEPALPTCPGRDVDVYVAFSDDIVNLPNGARDWGKVMAFASANHVAVERALGGDTTAVVLRAVLQMPPSPACNIGAPQQLYTDKNNAEIILQPTNGPQSAAQLRLTGNGSEMQTLYSSSGSPETIGLGKQTIFRPLPRGTWRSAGVVAGPGECNTSTTSCEGPSATYQCNSTITHVFNPPKVVKPANAEFFEDPTGFGSPLRVTGTLQIPADSDSYQGRASWLDGPGGGPAKLNFNDGGPSASPLIVRELAGGNPKLQDLWQMTTLGFATTNPPTLLPNPAAGDYTTGVLVPRPGSYAFKVEAISFAQNITPFNVAPYYRRSDTGYANFVIPAPPAPTVTLTASKLQVLKGESVTFTATVGGYVNRLTIRDQDNNVIYDNNSTPNIANAQGRAEVFNPLRGTFTTNAIVPTYGNATRQSTRYTATVYDYYSNYPGEVTSAAGVVVSPIPPGCTLTANPSVPPAPLSGQFANFVLNLIATGYVTESKISKSTSSGDQLIATLGSNGGSGNGALGQNESSWYHGEAFNRDVGSNLYGDCSTLVAVAPTPRPPTCDITLATDNINFNYDLTVKPGEKFKVRLWTFGYGPGGVGTAGSLIAPIPNRAEGKQCDDGSGCYQDMTVSEPGDYTVYGMVGDLYRNGNPESCSATVHVKQPKKTCNQFVHYKGWKCWEAWYVVNIPKNDRLDVGNCVGYGGGGGGEGGYEFKGGWDDDTDTRCGYVGNGADPLIRCSVSGGRCFHTNAAGEPFCNYENVNYTVSTLVGAPGAPGTHWTAGTAECPAYSISYSPLVVDFAGTGVELLAPGQGPKFDITGDGHHPHISWPSNADAAMHLVNYSNGKVKNINELFGNNTVGPDGKKASNGFLALAKFDQNKDGFVDASDAIFKNLRLWADRNHNGIAEPGELLTMAQAKIKRFDLAYLDLVEVVGFYGNLSRQRSVVELTDGKMLRVFDIYYVQRGEDI